MAKRREPRVELQLPIRVFGTDINGKAFSEKIVTIDVSRRGVKLSRVQAQIKVGETIGMTHGQTKGCFVVRWVGAIGTPRAGQIGIEYTSPEKTVLGRSTPRSQRGRLRPADWRQRPPPPSPNKVDQFGRTSSSGRDFAHLGQSNRSEPGWMLCRDADSAEARNNYQHGALAEGNLVVGRGKRSQQPSGLCHRTSVQRNAGRRQQPTERIPAERKPLAGLDRSITGEFSFRYIAEGAAG